MVGMDDGSAAEEGLQQGKSAALFDGWENECLRMLQIGVEQFIGDSPREVDFAWTMRFAEFLKDGLGLPGGASCENQIAGRCGLCVGVQQGGDALFRFDVTHKKPIRTGMRGRDGLRGWMGIRPHRDGDGIRSAEAYGDAVCDILRGHDDS